MAYLHLTGEEEGDLSFILSLLLFSRLHLPGSIYLEGKKAQKEVIFSSPEHEKKKAAERHP